MEEERDLRIVDAEAEYLCESESVGIDANLDVLIQGSFALRLQGGVMVGRQANPNNVVSSSIVGAINYCVARKRKRRRSKSSECGERKRKSSSICINWRHVISSSHEEEEDYSEEEQNMNMNMNMNN